MNVSHYPQTTSADLLAQLRALITPFGVLRLMNWQQTNHFSWSNRPMVLEWDDLPQPDSDWAYRGGPWETFEGVPLAVMIQFANEMGVRPWLCVPHGASEGLLEKMVQFIIAESQHRPILEYANEIWNDAFAQRRYAIEKGKHARPQLSEGEAALKWQAERTRLIAQVAQGQADVVVSAQFFHHEVANHLLALCGDVVQALAVAPYLGRLQRGVTQEGDIRPVSELYDEIHAELMNEIAPRITAYRQLCAHHHVNLWAYEGGLHQVARQPKTGDETRDNLIFSAEKQAFADFNRSEYGGAVTASLWQWWQAQGGQLACPYSIATIYTNKWDGSLNNSFFGHCEISEQTILPLPKYHAARTVLTTLL